MDDFEAEIEGFLSKIQKPRPEIQGPLSQDLMSYLPQGWVECVVEFLSVKTNITQLIYSLC